MSAFDDAATFANDPALGPPLTAAIVSAAIAICNEDPETVGHVNRKNLAVHVLRDPASSVPTFAWATSCNSTIVGKWVSDDHEGAMGDLAFVLGSVWDAVAGV